MKAEPIKNWGLEAEYTMIEEMKQKGARVASQGTTFSQKQKDSEDEKSVSINKSARRIKSLTNKEECQNCGKTGHPAECNYNKEYQNCGKTGHPAICCLHTKIVSLVEEDSADEIPEVDSPNVTVVNEPTGVIMGGPKLTLLKMLPTQDTIQTAMLSMIWH